MTERAKSSSEQTVNIDEMTPAELRAWASLHTSSFGRFLKVARLYRTMADVQHEVANQCDYPDAEEWHQTVKAFDRAIAYAEDLRIALAFGGALPVPPVTR